MTRAILSAVVLSAGMLWAPLAVADVAPAKPPDDCSVEKLCKADGQTCPALGGIVDESCAAGMTQRGMVQKCIQGASVGKAIYCPGTAASASASKKSCGKSEIAPTTPFEGASALGLVATALAVAGLRRARSRRSPTR